MKEKTHIGSFEKAIKWIGPPEKSPKLLLVYISTKTITTNTKLPNNEPESHY